jgi:hypothetical protein
VLGPSVEVEAVKLVFSMRLSGASYDAIAERLNAMDAKPPRATAWDRWLVSFLLGRKTYMELVPIGDKPQAKYHRMVQEPEYVENSHPVIVDSETWHAVQRVGRKYQRKAGPRKTGPLSGLLFCGRCDWPMHSTTNGARGN